jgi:hypothetical protein
VNPVPTTFAKSTAASPAGAFTVDVVADRGVSWRFDFNRADVAAVAQSLR